MKNIKKTILALFFLSCLDCAGQNADFLSVLDPEKFVSESGATVSVYDSSGVFITGRLIFGNGKTKACYLPAGKYFLDIISRNKDLVLRRLTITVFLK